MISRARVACWRRDAARWPMEALKAQAIWPQRSRSLRSEKQSKYKARTFDRHHRGAGL
jgi:hypothetical protein